MRKIIFQATVVFIFCFSFLMAEGSTKISYQGVLTNNDGTLDTGIVDLSFDFYTQQNDGSSFCSLSEPNVDLGTQGVFSVNLDLSLCSGGVPAFDNTYYMGITVTKQNSSPETIPSRIEITSAGYALNARHIQGASPDGNLFNAEGNVGIGTTQPAGPLDVNGGVFVTGSEVIRDNGTTIFMGNVDTQSGSHVRDVAIRVAGSDKLNIDSDGNIGIGTSPGAPYKLTIAGRLYGKDVIVAAGSDLQTILAQSWSGAAVLKAETGNSNYQWTADGNNNQFFLHDNNEGQTRITFKGDGNVGIGTTDPAGKLSIFDSGNSDTPGEAHKLQFGTSITPLFGFRSDSGNDHLVLDKYWESNGWSSALAINRNSGNVGIGTPDPDYKLEVDGTVGFTGGTVKLFGNGTQPPHLHFRNTVTGKDWILNHDENKFHIQSESNADTAATFWKIGENNTRLGIGTTAPGANLEVSSTGTAVLRIAGDSNNIEGEVGDATLQFTTDAQSEALDATITLENLGADAKLNFNVEDADVMTMHDGNVGIGTTSPSARLEINGGLAIRGDYPEDIWSTTNLTLGTSHAIFGTMGSYWASFAWNGYRSISDTWKTTGLNGNSESGMIEIGSSGIEFGIEDYSTIGPQDHRPTIRMRIKPDGNTAFFGDVGIGTDDPRSALDVSGHINSSSFLGVYNNDYNIWIQGSETATGSPSDGRNLALLGTSETNSSPDLLYLNFGSEYSGGTVIGGPVAIGTSPSSSFKLRVSDDVLVDDYLAASGGIHVGGTSDPGTDNLVVDGYTKLGSVAPVIKMQKIEENLWTASTTSELITFTTVSKIISVDILVWHFAANGGIENSVSIYYPPNTGAFGSSTFYQYNLRAFNGNNYLDIINAGDDIKGHSFVATITYEQ